MSKKTLVARVTVVLDLEMRPDTFARFRADRKDFEYYALTQCFRNHSRTLRAVGLEGPIVEDNPRLQADS